MKKLFAILIITTILISIPLVATVSAKPNVKKAIFVQKLDSFAKPEGVGKPPKPPKPDPEPEEPQLYELMGKNIKWIAPVELTYVINPTGNLDGLDYSDIYNAIETSAETWDAEVEKELFVSYTTDIVPENGDNYNDAQRDYTNEVFFADLPQEGAIAVCIVYYINVGPPSQRQILEFDLVFDADLVFVNTNTGVTYDYSWGDADPDGDNIGEPLIMDLQNIATHELGHSLGLADLYDTTAPVPEQTMYGYASAGETKKRTLETGDKQGIAVLYG
jgi:hypothetical protein